MARSERGEFFDCGIFRPLGRGAANHRLGLRVRQLPVEQEKLF